MRPVILYRAADMEDRELEAARRYFICFTERTRLEKDDLVIPRYSYLPYANELQAECDYVGATLINPIRQHRYVADLRNWVEDIQELTPKTWYRLEDVDQDGPYVLKGKTNSRKFDWRTHFFAENKAAASDVYWRLASDGLIGSGQQDIYCRKFVPLKTFMLGLNGLPISNEYRVFVAYGEIMCGAFYWSNYVDELTDKKIDSSQIPWDLVKEVIRRVGSKINFYTIDVAEKAEGGWVCIELNDGSMSGLSENNPEMLYARLSDTIRAKFGLGAPPEAYENVIPR